MNISRVFSTPERVLILNHIIFETESINVNQIANETKTSKGLVSKYLKILKEEDILKKTDQTYQVIPSSASKAVKILLNLSKIDCRIFQETPAIISAGLFGSAVNGANTKESDIDIWILHNQISPEGLSKITKRLLVIGDTKPVYLTIDKVNELRERDPVFYYSLIFGSIVLYGEHLDAL
ncbi:ArsR family transcriptional regulator [Candidatus Bathyarchaeota archaeon]|nr:MAG: ArsR family transcriptional regulator [Candidatus Bathyarchaeota archaeon]